MCKQLKSLLITVPICFALSGLTVLLYLIAPRFKADFFIVSSMVIVSIWSFFIVPAIFYTINWAKTHLHNADPAHSFRIGFVWGDLIFLLLIVVAPISGILWFIKTIKEVVLPTKNHENNANADIDTNDIFHL